MNHYLQYRYITYNTDLNVQSIYDKIQLQRQ